MEDEVLKWYSGAYESHRMIVSFLGSSFSQAVTFLPEMSSHHEQDVARLNQYAESNEIFALKWRKNMTCGELFS